MYDLLLEINSRPNVFSEYTARELWTDQHTADRMLSYHLNESIDLASRNHAFIEHSAAWIVSHFGLGPGARVADFGCGPGLYAQRLAESGLSVTGIDFSANSIRYARKRAAEKELDIEYFEADYLEFDTERRFDLIMMIMCDFCALSPDQRNSLLRKFKELLAPGGVVLLDVYSPRMYEGREESATYEFNLLDGFWSPGDYFGFLNVFKYDRERVLLDKYTIVERDRVRKVFNWLQCFEPTEVESEFESTGLRVIELLGDVAGKEYDPDAMEFAVAARTDGP